MLSLSFTRLALILLASSLGSSQILERCRHEGGKQCRASGCGRSPPLTPGSFKNFTTPEGREYRVWLPPNYDSIKATPLILSYHGANRQISRQVELDMLTDPLFNDDHIVVYLQGLEVGRPGHTEWEGAPDCDSDDIGFTEDVLDATDGELCVDEKRIFATGKSQGGGFVGRLACDPNLSNRIAAFAPVSGAYYIKGITDKSKCHPESVQVPCDAARTNIPIMAFHGGNDTTIKYHGGFRSGACLPDVSSWARQWALRDNLDGTPVNTTIAKSDNGVTMSYGGGLVTLVYDGDDIGHVWPSTARNDDNKGRNLAAFNASALIMEFFRNHKLP